MRYLPLMPLWLWYALKSRAVWWFTPSNPTLAFAGFDGEGKKEMYDQLPAHLYPKTAYVKPGTPWEEVEALIKREGFVYPFCVKPEAGLKGLLFRKIENAAALKIYHRMVPVEFLVQEMITTPLEVSVFYYRHPAREKGVITGFIQKNILHVVGNGRQTLLQLLQQHPTASARLPELRIKHEAQLQTVLPAGESYLLAHAANLSRGAQFISLTQQIDDRLLARFDPLSHRCKWMWGRYDIKCNSVEDLKAGRFCVLEFNGAGAEPNHVYGAGYSWVKALKEIAFHWKALYQISRYHHLHEGIPYRPARRGWLWMRAATAHARLLKSLDKTVPL